MGDDELDSELDSTNRRARRWQLAGLDRLNMGILLFVTVVLFRRQSSKSVLLMKFNLLFLGSMSCLSFSSTTAFDDLPSSSGIPSGHDSLSTRLVVTVEPVIVDNDLPLSTTFPPPTFPRSHQKWPSTTFPQGMTVWHDCMYSHAHRSRRQRPSTTFPQGMTLSPLGSAVVTVEPVIVDVDLPLSMTFPQPSTTFPPPTTFLQGMTVHTVMPSLH
ncbi:hypothetical protein EV702DRAFT_1200994 [Suillus placidus]|uniref:Uncharacterized protein n=1 Tax=Suillus placidus TaxID=48579 RepID=A0A9P6ZP36_9AGAM|nr:hypothetical protein EV702DRAFT_1200994 [Suillus placidus]